MRTHKNLMGIAAAMVLGSGYSIGLDVAAESPKKPNAPKRRRPANPYRPPNDIDLRPLAEAKRERKRLKRLAVREEM